MPLSHLRSYARGSCPYFHCACKCWKGPFRTCSCEETKGGQGQSLLFRFVPSSQQKEHVDKMTSPSHSTVPGSYKGLPVAVIGAGVSGCVAASSLAERGISVRLFESGRGPGGRLSTRRETMADGTELFFDHGAQYITVGYASVQPLVDKWQAAGLMDIWHARFGSYNFGEKMYSAETSGDDKPKYVGVPGMNSFCKFMAAQPGIKAQYNRKVLKLIWREEGSWLLSTNSEDKLGPFAAVVVSDKALASDRFRALSGFAPPLQDAGVPDIYNALSCGASVPCFTVMVAFAEPLTSIPFDRLTIEDSDLLAGAVRVSSKPGREKIVPNSELWVLNSTVTFAKDVINREGFSKPNTSLLDSIAQTLLREFQLIAADATGPFYVKAHRWGSSFPTDAVAPDTKCLVNTRRKLVACGDYCVSPYIDGAIVSGLAAAEAVTRIIKTSSAKF